MACLASQRKTLPPSRTLATALRLCLDPDSPSSSSRHPGCLRVNKPGPSPAQGLSFMGPSFWKILLDMLRGQASLLELLTFSFRQRHVLPPPPPLETNMLFILHLSPLYICFSNLSTLDIYSLIICLPSHRLGASIRFPLVSHVTALFFSGAWL